MFNNNPNPLYNPNVHTSRPTAMDTLLKNNVHTSRPTAVDTLLKGLGAEPLFSSINDPTPGIIPTPLNVPNAFKQSTTPQQDQNTFESTFLNILKNLRSSPSPQISQISSIPKQMMNNPPTSTSSSIPNPISILNEMHQRHKLSNNPPRYEFTMDPTTGHFYCQLDVFGKLFKTEHPTLRKQQAKEDAALMAIRTMVDDKSKNNNINNNINNANKSYSVGPDIMNNSANYGSDTLCKSEIWYKKQLNESPGKQPRVILLEFCQMHRLPTPTYSPFNDYDGNTFYECVVGDKCFRSDRSFPKSSEAKDYIARHAFEAIYMEMCELERKDSFRSSSSLLDFIESYSAKNSGGSLHSTFVGSIGNTGSNISSIGNNISSGIINNINSGISNISSGISNISSNQSNPSLGPSYTIGSPHSLNSLNSMSSMSSPLSTSSHLNIGMTSPHPNMTTIPTNSHLTSSHLTSPPHSLSSNITSPHSPISTNSNSSSHSLFSGSHSSPHLSNFGIQSFNEIPNIKIEEGIPLEQEIDLPFIKTEEGSINYPQRDQFQQQPNNSTPSSISFHPYRTPGRERFPPNPGLNSSSSSSSNINNPLNPLTKKSNAFCKKFTSLLYEMAQSKRWSPPEFNFENGINGFVCTCSIQDCYFKGKAFSRKMDAKESAAEEAYRFLIRSNFRNL